MPSKSPYPTSMPKTPPGQSTDIPLPHPSSPTVPIECSTQESLKDTIQTLNDSIETLNDSVKALRLRIFNSNTQSRAVVKIHQILADPKLQTIKDLVAQNTEQIDEIGKVEIRLQRAWDLIEMLKEGNKILWMDNKELRAKVQMYGVALAMVND